MKKNKTLKRFLTFLLCAAMLITYMPASAYTLADENAATTETTDTVETVPAAASDVIETEGDLEEAEEPETPKSDDSDTDEVADAVEKVEEKATEESPKEAAPQKLTAKSVPEKDLPATEDTSSSSGDNGINVQGSKKASPTTLGKDRKTTVTLAMPSGEYQNKVDIVFVMDNSTSIANAGYDFTESVGDLFESIVDNNQGIELKVAVIKFRGYATDMLGTGLTKYTSETKDTIKTAIKNNDVPGRGSNVHSGLVMAEKLLFADTSVDDDHKYVVLLTDGKSYIWNDKNDKPVTNYSQFLKSAKINSGGKPVLSQTSGSNNKESGPVYSSLPYGGESVLVYNNGSIGSGGLSSDYYDWLYNSSNSELSSATKYDNPAYYSGYYTEYTGAVQPEGTVTIIKPSNGTEVFSNKYSFYRTYYQFTPQAGSVWEDMSYYTVSPYKLKTNENGEQLFDTENKDPDFFLLHPDTLQKGVYTAGHYWQETLNNKYNTAAITLPANKIAGGSGLHIAGSFSVWLREKSDNGAVITEAEQVKKLFENIDNSIRYMVGKGVVTDEIADEFTLDMPSGGASPFKMTYDGSALTSTAQGGNKWNFGTADSEGVYPYVVEYAEDTKTITWTINVPIENLKQVTLSYDLILGSGYKGTYETNKSAVLIYTSSDGKYEDQKYDFEKPEVTYQEYSVTYEYSGTAPANAPELPAKQTGLLNGEEVTVAPAPTMAGYTFSGWSTNDADIVNGKFLMPEKDVTITGSWTENAPPPPTPQPHLSVNKITTSTTPEGGYKLGDTITYRITVTNDGSVRVSGITVTDTVAGNSPEDISSGLTTTTLEPGETATVLFTHIVSEQDVLAGHVVNVATATSNENPDVKPGTTDDPTEEQKPGISVTKSANKTSGVKQGETIKYTIVVTNTGNVTISGIDVSDTLVNFSGNDANNITLAPGATATITYSYKVTAADVEAGSVVNVATATGTAPDKKQYSGSDSVTVTTEEDEEEENDDTPTPTPTPPAPGGPGVVPAGPAPGGPVPAGPGVVPAAPDNNDGAVVPDNPVPEVEPEVDIDDNDTPLAEGVWALLNLIAAILTTLGAIVALFRRKEEEDEDEDEEDQNKPKTEEDEDEDDNRGKKMLAAKIAGAVAGVLAPIVFILTEDMSLPMVLIDKWTLLMVIILAAQIAAAIFNKKASELGDDEEEEEAEPAN